MLNAAILQLEGVNPRKAHYVASLQFELPVLEAAARRVRGRLPADAAINANVEAGTWTAENLRAVYDAFEADIAPYVPYQTHVTPVNYNSDSLALFQQNPAEKPYKGAQYILGSVWSSVRIMLELRQDTWRKSYSLEGATKNMIVALDNIIGRGYLEHKVEDVLGDPDFREHAAEIAAQRQAENQAKDEIRAMFFSAPHALFVEGEAAAE